MGGTGPDCDDDREAASGRRSPDDEAPTSNDPSAGDAREQTLAM